MINDRLLLYLWNFLSDMIQGIEKLRSLLNIDADIKALHGHFIYISLGDFIGFEN